MDIRGNIYVEGAGTINGTASLLSVGTTTPVIPIGVDVLGRVVDASALIASFSITNVTLAGLTTLINNSTLIAGNHYRITNRENIIVQAVTTNTVVSKWIERRYVNNTYYTVSGVNKGVLRPNTSYSVGDIIVWGGRVYLKTAGGTQTSSANYYSSVWNNPNSGMGVTGFALQALTNNTYYYTAYPEIDYNPTTDTINSLSYRGNTIGNQQTYANSQQVIYSDLGNTNIYDNTILGYIINNHANQIMRNKISPNTLTSNITYNYCNAIFNNRNKGDIINNILPISSNIYNNSNIGAIERNNISGSIYNNSNIGVIEHNTCGSIYINSNNGAITNNSTNNTINNNSNNGVIIYNSNNGAIYNNSNNGTISFNNNSGEIRDNANINSIRDNTNTGAINGNINLGSINDNANTGSINGNRNNGDISRNSSLFTANNNINFNRNNGYITRNIMNVNNVHIINNLNNGNIGNVLSDTNRSVTISDPTVNK